MTTERNRATHSCRHRSIRDDNHNEQSRTPLTSSGERHRRPDETLATLVANATLCSSGVCLATPLVVGLITGPASVRDARGHRRTLGREPRRIGPLAQPISENARRRSGGRSGTLRRALFVNHVSAPWSLVVLFGVVAFVAGLIEASLWATQGMYSCWAPSSRGLGFAGRVWQSAICLMVGGLFVYSVAG